MIKKIKMLLYGAPGVGKSVFASKFPKPFFITTDGNYEWLEDFGAKEEDHQQVNSWTEFLKFVHNNKFENYDTIVIDLIEDLFKWCESEFCAKNKIDYVGDLGYGKGYRITKDDFFVEMSKLIGLPKHVVFLSHETSQIVKDKRGVENTLYYPSKLLPESLRDQLEGRLRYVLRAKFEDELVGDKFIQRRILTLASDSNEFSIIRGVNMDDLRKTINLDFDEFIKELKLEVKDTPKEKVEEKKVVTKEVKKEVKVEQPKKEIVQEVKKEEKIVVKEQPKTEEKSKKDIEKKLEEKLKKAKVEKPVLKETKKIENYTLFDEEEKVEEKPKKQESIDDIKKRIREKLNSYNLKGDK